MLIFSLAVKQTYMKKCVWFLDNADNVQIAIISILLHDDTSIRYPIFVSRCEIGRESCLVQTLQKMLFEQQKLHTVTTLF